MAETKVLTHPISCLSNYRCMPEKRRDRTGGFDTFSNLLALSYFELREFLEPDVFPVFSNPKRTSLLHVFLQPPLEPVQAFCIYS